MIMSKPGRHKVHQQRGLRFVRIKGATPLVTVDAVTPPVTVTAATPCHTLTVQETSERGGAHEPSAPLHVETGRGAVEPFSVHLPSHD